jgi:antitoxin (DNA-binding transcriptional repressor) of toxin-antitoxin stability system
MNTLSIEVAGVEWSNILQDAMMGIPSLITKAGRPVAEVKPLKTAAQACVWLRSGTDHCS